MDKKKFSIIIPNYNCGEYIEDCLLSILKQNYNNYEIIVIDDGSTDNSLEILDKYKKNNSIKLYKTNRLKQGGARNKGLKMATGEYVLFLDSDDYLYDNVLSELLKIIKTQDVIFLGFYNEKKNKEIRSAMRYKKDIIKNDIWLSCWSKCWRKDFIDWEFPENMFLEDVYFTLKGYCKMNVFDFYPKPFFFYRFRENSTQNKSREKYRERAKEHVYKLINEFPEYELELKEVLRRWGNRLSQLKRKRTRKKSQIKIS